MPTIESVGLFLGAGASYELGMPLVWDLTGEFKGYFTPEHLRELNAGWAEQGGGYNSTVIEDAIQLIQRDDLHYENILGYLQTASRRHNQPFAAEYDGLYKRMVESISLLLYPRQLSFPYIQQALPPFEGLTQFAAQSSPIWVFSLNHDIMLQLLATHCGISLRDGFWPDKTLTIAGNRAPATEGSILANILTAEQLNSGDLHFFKAGEAGMNLMKLHGALDIFTIHDGLDLCRLHPVGNGLQGLLKVLQIANEKIGYWEGGVNGRVVNELMYADEEGVPQYLRRTLLAGAQKFNQRFDQTLPQKMLHAFRSYINYVQKLYIIGYSFGDSHIDLVLREWLEFSGARSIVIVDPRREIVPSQLAHLALQIELKRQTAGQFFSDYRTEPMTPLQLLEQTSRAARRPVFEKLAAKKW